MASDNKMIRLNDELYTELTRRAKENHLSITMMGQLMVGRGLNSLNRQPLIPKVIYSSEEEADIAGYEARAAEWEAGQRNLPDAMQSPHLRKGTPTENMAPKKIEAAPNLRTPQYILNQIKEYERIIEEEQEYNQDPESRDKSIAQLKQDIQAMWDEYHELKAS